MTSLSLWIKWITRELPLLFILMFSAVVMFSVGLPVHAITLFLSGESIVYFGAILVHEIGHLTCAKLFGVTASLSWAPRPTVTCGQMGFGTARLIATAGPILGAFTGLSGIFWLVYELKVSVMLYSIGLTLFISHTSMLLPTFPDGKILFNKQGFANE